MLVDALGIGPRARERMQLAAARLRARWSPIGFKLAARRRALSAADAAGDRRRRAPPGLHAPARAPRARARERSPTKCSTGSRPTAPRCGPRLRALDARAARVHLAADARGIPERRRTGARACSARVVHLTLDEGYASAHRPADRAVRRGLDRGLPPRVREQGGVLPGGARRIRRRSRRAAVERGDRGLADMAGGGAPRDRGVRRLPASLTRRCCGSRSSTCSKSGPAMVGRMTRVGRRPSHGCSTEQGPTPLRGPAIAARGGDRRDLGDHLELRCRTTGCRACPRLVDHLTLHRASRPTSARRAGGRCRSNASRTAAPRPAEAPELAAVAAAPPPAGCRSAHRGRR